MTNIAFTGTKNGVKVEQATSLLAEFKELRKNYDIMHNGDCSGADYTAAVLWKNLGGLLVLHPPIDSKHRAFIDFYDSILPTGEYLKRNHDMVNASSYLVATPKTMYEFLRSGTWATVRYARKVGIGITIIYPDGSVVKEVARNILA